MHAGLNFFFSSDSFNFRENHVHFPCVVSFSNCNKQFVSKQPNLYYYYFFCKSLHTFANSQKHPKIIIIIIIRFHWKILVPVADWTGYHLAHVKWTSFSRLCVCLCERGEGVKIQPWSLLHLHHYPSSIYLYDLTSAMHWLVRIMDFCFRYLYIFILI